MLVLSLILSIVPKASYAFNIADDGDIQKIAKKNLEEALFKKHTSGESVQNKEGGILETLKNENLNPDPEKKVRIMVEMNEKPAMGYVKNRKMLTKSIINSVHERVKAGVDSLYNNLRNSGIVFKSYGDRGITDTVITTVTMEVKMGDIKKIRQMPGVKDVQISEKYFAPVNPDRAKVLMYASTGIIHADNAWDLGYKGEGQLVGILDTGADLSHKDLRLDNEALSKIKLTKEKVSELKKSGLPGEYYNEKIPYIYNYQDSTSDAASLLDSSGSRHGMHVAGTVAANGESEDNPAHKKIKGVAPNAQIAILKVFSQDINSPYTYSDAQVRAVDDAVKIGCDSINLSLGARNGFVDEDTMTAKAFKRAAEAGCLVAVAAGNEGNTYSFQDKEEVYPLLKNPDKSSVGDPCVSKYTTGVASFENLKTVKNYALLYIDKKEEDMFFTWGQIDKEVKDKGFSFKEGELVYVGIAIDANGKQAPEFEEALKGNPDALKGKVALIKRGESSFGSKIEAVKKAGCRAAVIFDSQGDNADFLMGGVDPKFPSIFISNVSGEAILKNIEKTAMLIDGRTKPFDNVHHDEMSDFSAWGSAPDLSMKPEVSAPGGQIFSLDENNSYQNMSGTSMATPHIAGAAAIVSQFLKDKNCVFHDASVLGESSVREDMMKLLILNNSTPKKDADGVYYSVRRQGAGLLDLKKIIEQKVTARAWGGKDIEKDGKVEYKDFSGKKLNMSVELQNFSDKDVTYRTDISALKDKVGESPLFKGEKVLLPEMVNMNFDSPQQAKIVKVPAKSSVRTEISIDFTRDDIQPQAFVEGYIQFTLIEGSASDISIPYFGFSGDWNEPSVFDAFSNIEGYTPQFLDVKEYKKGNLYPASAVYNGFGYPLNVSGYGNEKCFVYGPRTVGKYPIVLGFGLLRNIENYKSEMLDADKKNPVLLNENDRLRKAHFGTGEWHTFDPASQYKTPFKLDELRKFYYRIQAKPSGVQNASIQIKDVPVLYDPIKPVIKNYEIFEENGSKYIRFEMNDNIDIAYFGISPYDKNGSIRPGIEFPLPKDDPKWNTQDEKSKASILSFKNDRNKTGEVIIKIDSFLQTEHFFLYVEDIAHNIESVSMDTGVKVQKAKVTLTDKSLSLYVENIHDAKAEYGFSDTETAPKTFEFTKGDRLQINAKLPDLKDDKGEISKKKKYDLEYLRIKKVNPDNTVTYQNMECEYVSGYEGYVCHYNLDTDISIEVKYKIVDIKDEPAEITKEPVIYKRPGISLQEPSQFYVAGDMIEENKLNVWGYVTNFDWSRIEKVYGEFLDEFTDKPVKGSEKLLITERDKDAPLDENKHPKFTNGASVLPTKIYENIFDDSPPVYDAYALNFDVYHIMPLVEGAVRYRLTVVYTDEEGKLKSTSSTVLMFIERNGAKLKINVLPRDVDSNEAVIDISINDNSIDDTIELYKLDENLEYKKIYMKSVSKKDMPFDSVNNVFKDRINVKLVNGKNVFVFKFAGAGSHDYFSKQLVIYKSGTSSIGTYN